MPEGNQDDAPEVNAEPVATGEPAAAAGLGDGAPPPGVNGEAGLFGWLIVIGVAGLAALLLGQQELAALVGVAGLFVAAQAADVERRWRPLYLALAWIVPVSGVGAFFALGRMLGTADPVEPLPRMVLLGYVWAAGLVSVLLWIRPVADPLVRALFRQPGSHTLRLAARLVVLGLLLAIPAAVALRDLVLDLLESPDSPLTASAFAGSLAGYVALALAGTGFMIRRSAAGTFARLGLSLPGWRHLGISALTVLALFALTTAADAVQKAWLHDLWLRDQAMNEALAGGLGIPQGLLLGISAGVGEEITMRGALQPKLGVVLTALLFASFHVQYTWFGILVVFLLGVLLGVVRARTSTSVAMIAHTGFDVVAVFTT